MQLEVIIIGIGGPGLGSAQVLKNDFESGGLEEIVPPIGARIDFYFSTDPARSIRPAYGETWLVKQNKTRFELFARSNQVQLEITVDREGKISGAGLPPGQSPWSAVQIDLASLQPWCVPNYIDYTPTPAGRYFCQVVPGETNMLYFLKLVEPASDNPVSPSIIHNITSQIELVGAIFNWQTGAIRPGPPSSPEIFSSHAIKMLQPVAPEFPLLESSVVAYPLDQMASKEKIYCCFRTANMDLRLKVVHVRAIQQGWPDSCRIAKASFSFSTTELHSMHLYSSCSMLNSVSLYQGFIPLEINTSVITNQEENVGEYRSDWLWQSTLDDPDSPDAVWHNIQRMPVVTCLTLREPQYPWATGHFTVSENPPINAYPFERLLRLACRWAAGARNEFDVAKKITEHLLASPLFLYSTSASTFTVYNAKDNIPISPCNGENACVVFNANKLNEIMEGMNGTCIPVDCVDLCHIVMLLANSIGCNMKLAILYNEADPVSGFCVNPIIPLGSDDPNAHYSFTFHQVAYLGNAENGTALVFDPCFRFYTNGLISPTLGTPLKDYIEKLELDPGSIRLQQGSCPEIIQLI